MASVGVIGCGRIGSAVLKRLAYKHGSLTLLAHDRNKSKVDHINRFVAHLNDKSKDADSKVRLVEYAESIAEIVQDCEYIILAIQFSELDNVIAQMTPHLTENHTIISLMASVPIQILRAKTRFIAPVVRAITNIPATYGRGIIAICFPKEVPEQEIKNKVTYFVSEKHKDFIASLFKPLGQRLYLEEDKLPIFTAVVACGPAYTYYFMEALIQAAVTIGIPYNEAKRTVGQLVEGSAYLCSHEQQSTTDLRLQATPPGGICNYAINKLEENAVKGIITNAILHAHEENARIEEEIRKTIESK